MGLKLSFLADQLGGGAGGGRFTSGFLRALLADSDALSQIDKLYLLVTENQPTKQLGPLPPKVQVIHRRFPSRLRQTVLADWASRTFPYADVAHGPFFYVFPSQGKRTLITLHDTSFLNDSYHTSAHNRAVRKHIAHRLTLYSAIVCDSRAVLLEVQAQWPHVTHQCRVIYPGVGWVSDEVSRPLEHHAGPPYILAVGTIEPRKNYSRLLDAYEQLRSELGDDSPQLMVVGKAGWMSEAVCSRLTSLAGRGWLRWFQTASDAELARLYRDAAMFTYISLYEGFGYPPFEAAYAGIPMVLSNQSSVGEIWSGYAYCVDPTDVRAILAAWKWALGLSPEQARSVADRQYERAIEFSWKRCVSEYVSLYDSLAQSSI